MSLLLSQAIFLPKCEVKKIFFGNFINELSFSFSPHTDKQNNTLHQILCQTHQLIYHLVNYVSYFLSFKAAIQRRKNNQS